MPPSMKKIAPDSPQSCSLGGRRSLNLQRRRATEEKPSQTKRAFRKVRFTALPDTYYPPPSAVDDDDDDDPSEPSSTWLSRDELMAIRQDCLTLVARITERATNDKAPKSRVETDTDNESATEVDDEPEQDDIRGLEWQLGHLTGSSYYFVPSPAHCPRFKAQQTVFDVQRLERMQGVSHASFLAKLLRRTTTTSRRTARALGAHDAAAAKAIMDGEDGDDRTKTPSST